MLIRSCFLWGLMAVLAGCSLEQELSRTPRTAVEQVLLTQAVSQALNNLTVQVPAGVNIELDATGLESDRSRLRMTNSDLGSLNSPNRDILYIRDTVAAELGRRGYLVRAREMESPYLVRVMAESFGTMQGITFFGMPPVQSLLIPFAPGTDALQTTKPKRLCAAASGHLRQSHRRISRLLRHPRGPNVLQPVHDVVFPHLESYRYRCAAVICRRPLFLQSIEYNPAHA